MCEEKMCVKPPWLVCECEYLDGELCEACQGGNIEE